MVDSPQRKQLILLGKSGKPCTSANFKPDITSIKIQNDKSNNDPLIQSDMLIISMEEEIIMI